MVAGAYHPPRAPSHAERVNRQREKGKGWTRSKSSMYESGSDFYFSEDRAMQRSQHSVRSSTQPRQKNRRANSSMSRAERNSGFYEINCPAKRPPRRRASVEAIVKTAKSESARSNIKCREGPPVQKRMLTVAQEPNRFCATPNKNLYGWTVINKDRVFNKVEISDGLVPATKNYAPKHINHDAEAIYFQTDEVTGKNFACEPRRMDMLITTSDFSERLNDIVDVPPHIVFDGDHYPNLTTYPPNDRSPFAKYVNELKLELEAEKVPLDRTLKGRVYLDLKETSSVDTITLDINNTTATVSPVGVISLRQTSDSMAPRDFRIVPCTTQNPATVQQTSDGSQQPLQESNTAWNVYAYHPKKYKLSPGRYTFDFELYVPRNQAPSFVYVNPKNGASAINNYSVDAAIRINGKTERIGRVPFDVPALGKRNQARRLPKKDLNRDVLVPSIYVTATDGVDYIVGDSKEDPKHEEARKVTGKIRRIIKSSGLGDVPENIQSIGDAKSGSGKSHEVLTKYKNNSNDNTMGEKWDKFYYDQNNVISSTVPSINMGAFFSCEYELLVETPSGSYKCSLVRCDEYDDSGYTRTDLGSNVSNGISRIP